MKKINLAITLLLLGTISVNASSVTKQHFPTQTASFSNFRVDAPKRVAINPLAITNVLGNEVLYNKTCAGLYLFQQDPYYYEDTFGTQVVWGDNNEVYFYNIMTLAEYPTYVKGTVSGSEITIDLPQNVYSENGTNIDLVGLKIHEYTDEYGRPTAEYVPDNSITTMKYTVNANGIITMVLPGKAYDYDNLPDYAFGYIDTETNQWTGFCDFAQILVPIEGAVNRLPEGLELTNYTFVYDGYGIFVKIGFDDSHLYIVGLNPNMPDGIIIADIDGDIATIRQNQIMGSYYDVFMYTKCVVENPNYDYFDDYSPEYLFAPEDAVYELVLSNDRKTITSKDDTYFLCLNGALNRLYYLAAYKNISFNYQDSFVGTPQNPHSPYWYDEFFMGGTGTFFFYIPDTTEDGTLLQKNDLYYRIYTDGQVMTFQEEKNPGVGRPAYFYPGLTEPTTLIPYSFTNWQDIYLYADTPRRMVELYNSDFTTVGVQTVYIYEGVTTESDILTYDIITGVTTIVPKDFDGVSDITPDIKPQGVYNLQGMKLYEAATPETLTNLPAGIYIVNGRKLRLN